MTTTAPGRTERVAGLGPMFAPRGIAVLVEAMAPPGVDLVLGARRDPVFGPVLLLGLGGTTAEALADVAIRLAPVSHAEAAANPGLAEIEVNPLRLTHDGLVALDGVIISKEAEDAHADQ